MRTPEENLSLWNEILAHPGHRRDLLIASHQLSKKILNANISELRRALTHVENSLGSPHQNSTRSETKNRYDEVSIRFHNFIASAVTLVDHTRVLMDRPDIHPQHKIDHLSEIKTMFGNNQLINFTHRFRNLVLHCSSPWISGRSHNITGAKPQPSVHINLVELETWNGWNASSRHFIASNKPDLKIRALVDEYEKTTEIFYIGFYAKFEKYYEAELKAVSMLWKRFNESAT